MKVLFRAACALIVVVSALPLTTALAATLDGNQLFELCTQDVQVCTGYVMGVADAKQGDQQAFSFCIPDGVTRTRLQEVVMNSLRKNTERRFPAPLLVGGALAEAFPCRR